MKNAQEPGQTAYGTGRSVYEHVGGQVDALVSRLGLQSRRSQIMQVYGQICRDSLGYALGARLASFSRINHDGTPFQYCVTLGVPFKSLQFLGEAGRPDLSGRERFGANRACISAVAESLSAGKELRAVAGLLDELAPDTNVDLLADPGGAFWIGVGFASARAPRLKIYTNASWGHRRDRWARLEAFAAFFGVNAWRSLANRLAPDLKPLGTALTLCRGKPPSGRIYLTTLGKRVPYYRDLARSTAGDRFARVLERYARCVLGPNYRYPTMTSVCSFALEAGREIEFKWELCGHCLFSSDVEAVARLRTWFGEAGLDATGYWSLLDVLAEGRLSPHAPDLHCYVGVGNRGNVPYTTVYLKPKLIGMLAEP